MEQFRGKIEDETGNLIMDVGGLLAIETPAHGMKSWHGSFPVKPGQGPGLVNRHALVLRLADGRSGRFLLEHYSPQTGQAQFRGTGPLSA
jgi:hypothetical protein